MPFMFVVMIVMLAASALMAVLTKNKTNTPTAANLQDFNFPMAQQGACVPFIAGTVRLNSPNTIWYGDYGNSAVKQCSGGIFGSTCQTIGYKYYIGLDEALCLGPGVNLLRMWAGKDVVFQEGTIYYGTGSDAGTEAGNYAIFTDDTMTENLTLPITATTRFYISAPNLFGGDKSAGGLQGWVTFYQGNFDEARSTYVADQTGDGSIPAYNGVARMVFESFYIGTSTNLQAFNFELQRMTDDLYPGYGIGWNGYDLNPLEVAYQCFVSDWGGWALGVDSIDLPSWQAAAVTLHTEGNVMSLMLQSDKTFTDVLDQVCQQIDGFIYQDPETMKIKVKLVRQDYTVADLPVITQADITEMTSFMKSTWLSTYNQVRINFKDRENSYTDNVAVGQDFANINYQGKLANNTISLEGVHDPSVANLCVINALVSTSCPLYKIEIKATRAAATLRPGDCFVLNYAPYGLTEMVFRVATIDLGSLEDGTVVLSAIQDKFAANTILFAAPPATLWQPNPEGQPRAIVTQAAIELPYFLQRAFNPTITIPDGNAKLYYFAVAPSGLSTAFDAQLSLDNFADAYTELSSAAYSNSARLTASYSSSAGGTDRFDTVGITIGSVTNPAILLSGTTGYTDGSGLIQIDTELLSYSGYTNNGDGTYTLLNVQRGFLDTLPASHAANSYLWFIGANQSGMGSGLWPDTSATKWREMDQRGASGFSPDSATQNSLTLVQRAQAPLCPAYLEIDGQRVPDPINDVGTITISWRERNRLKPTLSFYSDPTDTPEDGVTYTISYTVNGGAATVISGLTGTSYTLDATHISGTVVFTIEAVRGSQVSTIQDTITAVINAAGAGYGWDYGVSYG